MKRTGKIAAIILLLALALWKGNVPVKADTLNDAYDFVNTYGNRTIFQPISSQDGEVCFGTAAGKATSSYMVTFQTIGWQVYIKNSSGTVLQRINYKRGGNYLTEKSERDVDGIEYHLYTIRLSTLLSHLNGEAKEAVNAGNAAIELNACMIVNRYGDLSGSMDNSGNIYGNVYTDYEGICNSFGWSAGAKEAFKSYYGKQIENIYRTLYLEKGKGMKSVSGGGMYLYGTKAVFRAEPEKGYRFAYWSGDTTFYENTESIIMDKDYRLKAYSSKISCEIRYYRNLSEEDDYCTRRVYYYGEKNRSENNLPWEKEGYSFLGWGTQKDSREVMLKANEKITDEFILAHSSGIKLYGIWEPNRYCIMYVASESKYPVERQWFHYTGQVTLNQSAKHYITGLPAYQWEQQEEEETYCYAPGEVISGRTLAERAGIVNKKDGVVYLYCQWASMPVIKGEDFYFSVEEAQSGILTEDYLARYVSCSDSNDGRIPYGEEGKRAFSFVEFDGEKYRNVREECVFTERLFARNSMGYETTKKIGVHLVESFVKKVNHNMRSQIRFVSSDAVFDENGELKEEEEGGLKDGSLWRKDSYLEVLRKAFGE